MSHSKVTCRHCGAAYWDGDPHTCPYLVTCPRCASVYLSNTTHICRAPKAAPAPPVPPPPTLSADAQALFEVLSKQLEVQQFFARLAVGWLTLFVIGAFLWLIIASAHLPPPH